MSLRGSMFISFFLALMIPGVGAGQEAAVRSLGDISARARGRRSGARPRPTPFGRRCGWLSAPASR